eukprot:CAMPEP_0195526904 /NCGR_PEP_ID=MMETSP0794_2-20130614/28232_1 /TAXON_ID=515487 /ORGANISM="Stephanopyxis turris, Strain CCMP 815" /LENGTH=947 /DNA_ID=CAMNT_0040657693 /DNA_START=380 /DNA_END=3223 /DNA_ORIENTATION=+
MKTESRTKTDITFRGDIDFGPMKEDKEDSAIDDKQKAGPYLQLPGGSWQMNDMMNSDSVFTIKFPTQLSTRDSSSSFGFSKQKIFTFSKPQNAEDDASISSGAGTIAKLYLKCPDGGNEKSLWCKAARKLDCLASDNSKKIKLRVDKKWRYRKEITITNHKMSVITNRGPNISTPRDNWNGAPEDWKQKEESMKMKEYKVNPTDAYPHVWMTVKEMENEMMRPSSRFHDLRESTQQTNLNSPEIGSLFAEVLCCRGLPKLDVLSDTDAVVYLVCGAYAFCTDVIDDNNNPMWLRHTRRAAIFPLHNTYARLYAGVFDDDGDFAGRIGIDIASLRPGCIYDVSIPLRQYAHSYYRQPRGVIRLRLRVSWNNSRAAVLSHLSRPKDLPAKISCNNRKAFLCVALTVHGKDMNGIFSPNIVKATTREIKLYKVQVKALVKTTLKELVTWEIPFVSGFIFFGWMHSVYANSVSLSYPYFVGYVIICLMRNYARYSFAEASHKGFPSLTISEIFLALLGFPEDSKDMKPSVLNYHEDPQTSSSSRKMLKSLGLFEGISDIEETDHMEFPFSYRTTYKKMSLGDSIANFDSNHLSNNDEEDDSEYEHFFQTSVNGRTVFPSDRLDLVSVKGSNRSLDSKMEDFSMRESPLSEVTESQQPSKLLPTVPEQNMDIKVTAKKTFQEMLNNDRAKFHHHTGRLFDDEVFSIPRAPTTTENEYKTMVNSMEKTLGMKSQRNPILGAMDGVATPILLAIRCGLRVFRAVFNLFMWKDPILSFWLLIICICLLVLLIVFPWRPFMFIVGVVLLGPQNWFLTQREKKSQKNSGESVSNTNKNDAKKKENNEDPIIAAVGEHSKQFSGHRAQQSSQSYTKNTMEVVVPYSPLKQDRFYDWPPEPSLSSVTKDESDDDIPHFEHTPPMDVPENKTEPKNLSRSNPFKSGTGSLKKRLMKKIRK